MSKALADNCSLRSLNLTCNNIGLKGGVAIAEALRVNRSLTTLVLWGNKLGPEGGVALAEALKINGSLTSLNIRLNGIGVEGGKAVAEALRVNGSLTELDLDRNMIGDEGWCAIFDTLRDNSDTKIAKWFLGGEDINLKIALSLAAYVAASGSLTSLDLRVNNIGDAGGKAIAEALRSNGSLITNLE